MRKGEKRERESASKVMAFVMQCLINMHDEYVKK